MGMQKQKQTQRVFSAKFKHQAVRRMAERRAQGVTVKQFGVKMDGRPEVLRAWNRQVHERSKLPLPNVFPGHGRLPSEEEAMRHLQRENKRLQQEDAFLNSAATYFAKVSR